MYDIESILMALFGGGYGDWNFILYSINESRCN